MIPDPFCVDSQNSSTAWGNARREEVRKATGVAVRRKPSGRRAKGATNARRHPHPTLSRITAILFGAIVSDRRNPVLLADSVICPCRKRQSVVAVVGVRAA